MVETWTCSPFAGLSATARPDNATLEWDAGSWDAGSWDAPDDGDAAETYFATLMADAFLEAPAPTPDRDPARPESAGPWTLGRQIGKGGTGFVYEAWNVDPSVSAPAVVKVARPRLPPDAKARFFEEARTLALFRHDSVVVGFGAGLLPDERPYLAMERVWGTSVTRFARPLAVRQRLEVFQRICEAVAVVHRRGIVHCDLKPGNIFVTVDGRVKLLDFGIARRLDGGRAAGETPLLTPDYASPEQLLGTDVSLATDVYALALLLHDLLCGRRRRVPWGLSGGGETVFSGTLTCAIAGEAGAQKHLAALDAVCTEMLSVRVDWRVGEVLCRALQTDPGRRYPSAAELSAAVGQVLLALHDCPPTHALP